MNYDVSKLLGLFNDLLGIYGTRNSDYDTLRDYYLGQYWENSQAKGIRLVYNKINEVVSSYVDAVSVPPDSWVIPPNFTPEGRAKAQKLDFYLDFVWDRNHRIVRQQEAAHDQSLLGVAWFHVRPAPDSGHWFRIIVPDPKYCFPVYKRDLIEDYEGFFYAYRRKEKRQNPEKPWLEEYDKVEYWDNENMVLINLDSQAIEKTVRHGAGRVPFVSAPNLIIPRTDIHQGDANQIVGLTEHLNEALSTSADELYLHAYPPLVIEGQQIGGSDIIGPGAVIEITKGSKAYYLQVTAPAPPLRFHIQQILEAINVSSRMSDLARAQRTPRETLGKTTSALMWRTGSRVTTKETNMVFAIQELNSMILNMTENLYGNQTILLQGVRKNTPYALEFKGNEAQGLRRNLVRFKPLPWETETEIASPKPVGPAPVAGGGPPPGTPEQPGTKEAISPQGQMTPELREQLFPPPRGQDKKKSLGSPKEKGEVNIYEVVQALKSVKKKFKGKVYVAGGLITEGRTANDIDVFLENPNDKGVFLSQFDKETRKWFHFSRLAKGEKPDTPTWLEVRGGESKGRKFKK